MISPESKPELLKEDILVKVSGDLIDRHEFYDWLGSIGNFGGELFIICGGGSAITSKLNEHGIGFEFEPMGRRTTLEGRELATSVLLEQMAIMEEKLKERKINATVLMPVIETASRDLHMNGDIFTMGLYPNFGKIYVVTLKGRSKEFGENLERVELIQI